MATQETRVCDVYGTYDRAQHRVYPTRVTVECDTGEGWQGGDRFIADLSPRAIARLQKFIGRGLKPPTKPKAGEAATETT